jgi:hypothetical protein
MASLIPLAPPWPSWQGEREVQSFDLDGVGSIPTIYPTQFTCFIDEFNKLHDDDGIIDSPSEAGPRSTDCVHNLRELACVRAR